MKIMVVQFPVLLFAIRLFQYFRMPVPFIPPVNDVMSVTFLLDSFVLAVLGFCISLSMGKPIAKMFNYELDATDELWAEVK